MFVNTSYLQQIYDDPKQFKRLVQGVARNLRRIRKNTPFDALAFTGTSGAAMAYPLSMLMDIPLICVRKSTVGTHSMKVVEGSSQIDVRTYMIIDDFTSSGDTIKAIMRKINKLGKPVHVRDSRVPAEMKCVGVALYSSNEYMLSGLEGIPKNLDYHFVCPKPMRN